MKQPVNIQNMYALEQYIAEKYNNLIKINKKKNLKLKLKK